MGTSTLDALDENLVRRYYNHLIGLEWMSGLRKKNLFNTLQSTGPVAAIRKATSKNASQSELPNGSSSSI